MRIPKLVAVHSSAQPGKKLTALFDTGAKVHFGSSPNMDFTKYILENGMDVAKRKRAAYIARHRVNEDWLDPQKPGTLSRIILWEFATVEEGCAKYNATVAKWRSNPALRYKV